MEVSRKRELRERQEMISKWRWRRRGVDQGSKFSMKRWEKGWQRHGEMGRRWKTYAKWGIKVVENQWSTKNKRNLRENEFERSDKERKERWETGNPGKMNGRGAILLLEQVMREKSISLNPIHLHLFLPHLPFILSLKEAENHGTLWFISFLLPLSSPLVLDRFL